MMRRIGDSKRAHSFWPSGSFPRYARRPLFLVGLIFTLASVGSLPSPPPATLLAQEAALTKTQAAPSPSVVKLTTDWLARPLLVGQQSQTDIAAHVETRVRPVTVPPDANQWRAEVERRRNDMMERVVMRGVPPTWRSAEPPRVEWLGEVEERDEYRIKRLRYEALPGLWIPALLYEPKQISGKVAVSLHVNGHDGVGKAAPYKQIRCLNLVRRGLLALNVEWLGMGQLKGPGYAHGRLNQLDLCGVAGLAPFYLSMQRGLDVLLAHPNADPTRVAVAGLSGGGWQTIYISALDPRVTLANPVAGYSSFRTRARHHSDLGDSEQTPSDMGIVADYSFLTAMRAPRPTLLTYNLKDNCCFASGHALPPLVESARPAFALLGAKENLRSHINEDPGTHNFEQDNREAFYRMLADHGFASTGRPFPTAELDCQSLVKTEQELMVELPADNLDLNQLAVAAAKGLPRSPAKPTAGQDVEAWRSARQAVLRDRVRWETPNGSAQKLASDERDGFQGQFWRIRVNDQWTLPVVEITPSQANPARGATILVAQGGRASVSELAATLATQGEAVFAVDPLFWGESRVEQRAYLFQLLVATAGSRPLGIQAAQIAATAHWLRSERQFPRIRVVAVGDRASLATLTAAALEPAIADVTLSESLGSLHEVIERDWTYDQAPELFCFGLLEEFDIASLVALVAPRPVRFKSPSDRVRRELASQGVHYEHLSQ